MTSFGTEVSEKQPTRPMPPGFRPDGPGRVYLLRHPQLRALKIGVTGSADDVGTESIEADGWERIATWWFAVGFDALAAEDAVLDRWRNVFSLSPAVRPDQLLQSDADETVVDTRSTRRDTVEFLDALTAQYPVAATDADLVDPWDESLRRLVVA